MTRLTLEAVKAYATQYEYEVYVKSTTAYKYCLRLIGSITMSYRTLSDVVEAIKNGYLLSSEASLIQAIEFNSLNNVIVKDEIIENDSPFIHPLAVAPITLIGKTIRYNNGYKYLVKSLYSSRITMLSQNGERHQIECPASEIIQALCNHECFVIN